MEDQFLSFIDPLQEKYERLLDAHEKLQKLNQCLEDKLLKLAEDQHLGTTQLSHQTQNLTQRLVEARLYIHQLEEENDRYRNDINVVVQLLHCKPSTFISSKIDALPEDLQRKVLGQKNMVAGRKEKKIIKVQVPTLPHTDIMYSVDKARPGRQQGEKDMVSAAIMAKVLEEREKERDESLKNRCTCASRIRLPMLNKETQTIPSCTISCIDLSLPEDGAASPPTEIMPKSGPTFGVGSSAGSSADVSAHQSSSSSLSSHSPTWIRRPDSLNLDQAPKRAGHCVRVLTDKERRAEAHWTSTVLVQHPPKSHSFARDFDGSQQRHFDHRSPDTEPDEPLSANTTASTTHVAQQYYRAQKRSFWTRSSSTTSTETEI